MFKNREWNLIRQIQASFKGPAKNVLLGIGDDCAVLPKNAAEVTLVSTDALIENVHFRRRYFSFFELGQKAAAVNLSDIAAMGGKPEQVLVSLGVPKSVRPADILQFYDGLKKVLSPHGVALVGGNLAKSPHDFLIQVTILGSARKNQDKRRAAAKVGDDLYVTGPLGAAALGFHLLEKRQHSLGAAFIKHFKTPQAQVVLGQKLGQHRDVHALMDVSDGLLGDLLQMLQASGVSAVLQKEKIPTLKSFAALCAKLKLSADALMLAGGEDYQLLFTASARAEATLKRLAKSSRHKIFKIGKIVSSKNDTSAIQILNHQKPWPWSGRLGFDHFP